MANSNASWCALVIAALVWITAVGAYAKTTASANAAAEVSGDIGCADFLAALDKKPTSLEFLGCEKIVQHGTPALEARYRVAGVNAAAVEAYFVKSARMPRLRFLCCGWESVPVSQKSQARTGAYVQRGQRFQITMNSGESVVHQRNRWADIAYFHVKATTYTELP